MSDFTVCDKALSKLQKKIDEKQLYRKYKECIDSFICPKCGSGLIGKKLFQCPPSEFDIAKCGSCNVEYILN